MSIIGAKKVERKGLREGLRNRNIVLVVAVIFIVFVFTYFVRIERSITSMVFQGFFITVGRLTQSIQVSLTILTNYLYDLVVDCDQGSVYVGNSVSADITIKNNGNYEGDMTVEWWIEDTGATRYTSASTVVNISSGYMWRATKSLIVPSTTDVGIYYFKTNISTDDYSLSAHDSFEVLNGVTTTPPPVGGGGIGSPSVETTTTIPEDVAEEVGSIEIFYPPHVIVVTNSTKEVNILVKNSGTLVLDKLKLLLRGIELDWVSVYPEEMILREGESNSFRINFSVPIDVTLREYSINVIIESEELEERLDLTFSVIETLKREEFEEKKSELRKTIQTLSEQLESFDEEREDVRSVKDLLTSASERILLAEIYVEDENLEICSELIYEAEGLVVLSENAFNNIKNVKSKSFLPVMLLSFTVASTSLVSILIIRKVGAGKLYKRLMLSVKIKKSKREEVATIMKLLKTLEREVENDKIKLKGLKRKISKSLKSG